MSEIKTFFIHFSFHLIFFIHDTPSVIVQKKTKIKIDIHTVLPGGHVSRGLRCLIGPKHSF